MTNSSGSSSAAAPAAPPFWFLALTAAGCGALIMVIEVLGSRVIGPFFGVSLFVWTALISVTMIALALGYWAGGLLSARGRPRICSTGRSSLRGSAPCSCRSQRAPC